MNVLLPAETVEVEDSVRSGVFADDTDTVLDVTLSKGLLKVIVYPIEEAGSKRVRADGLELKTLGSTTVFPDFTVKT